MDNNFNIIDLGYRTAGESIFIQANIPEDKGDESVQFFAAGLNIDNFIEGYEILNENSLKDIDFKETDVKGKVNMKKDGIMFTSIPYDEGWTVYVDGKKTEYFAISDAFLAFDISNGEHTVEFKFMPKGLLVGVGVSAVTLFILLIIAVYLKKSKNKWWDYDNSADELKSDGFRLIETTVYEDLE